MVDSVNQTLADRKINNQALARRFERNLTAEVDARIDAALARILRIVERGSSQREILIAIRSETQALSVRMLAFLEPQLRRYISMQTRFEYESIRRALGRTYRIQSIDASFVRDLVTSTPLRDSRVLREHFVGIGLAQRTRIEQTLRRGRLERLSFAEIADQLRDGPLDKVTRLQARSVVRTAVTQMATEASTALYEANGGFLRGYMYVATLDSRTTPICARNDGRVFAFDAEYQPKPPLHWNCRSTTVPVLMRFSQVSDGVIRRNPSDALRASINGPVAAQENYGEWLFRQPRNIQLLHLEDPARVALFRQGNLTLTQFSDVDGNLLSIERLETLNRRATRGSDG